MSRYQWYAFVAPDRPLTSKEMAGLRAISTRAEIARTRFCNEYRWRSFSRGISTPASTSPTGPRAGS